MAGEAAYALRNTLCFFHLDKHIVRSCFIPSEENTQRETEPLFMRMVHLLLCNPVMTFHIFNVEFISKWQNENG